MPSKVNYVPVAVSKRKKGTQKGIHNVSTIINADKVDPCKFKGQLAYSLERQVSTHKDTVCLLFA